MSDLQQYINNRKAREPEFAQNFEEGYQAFKIGFLLKQAREEARLTQKEVAKQLNLRTATISRIEKSFGRHQTFHIREGRIGIRKKNRHRRQE